jgi:YD repeat-containing protein
MGYKDLIYPGGFEPKIERVYNSKSGFRGIFGHGWGSEYEVTLTVSADGSVVVKEYGGGADNRFVSINYKPSDLTAAVTKIVDTARKTGALGSNDQIQKYKAQLLADVGFRNQEWERFVRAGKLVAPVIPVGTQFKSNRFNYQYITKTAQGFVRTHESGKNETFDAFGKLVKVQDNNNNFIVLSYTKDGNLEKLVDNTNRKMFFFFNSLGTLERVEGENGKKATYQYNTRGELTQSKDVDGNTYGYAYDNEGRHNLKEIAYADNTKMKIQYYPRDKFENVQSVIDRDGTTTEYVYQANDAGGVSTYTVAVTVKSKDGNVASRSKYDYVAKTNATGEKWNWKMISRIDDDLTETEYNEACGLPVSIKRGPDVTTFKYDVKCRVAQKVTPFEKTELRYHPKVGKVEWVQKTPRGAKKPFWSKFQYDNRGNLTYAENSDAKTVRLAYDTAGRIRVLVDKKGHQITFKYDENSKPIEIADANLKAAIRVTYKNSGEVKSVESTAGRQIAMQVTSTFQGLLEIIRPAGVSLTF